MHVKNEVKTNHYCIFTKNAPRGTIPWGYLTKQEGSGFPQGCGVRFRQSEDSKIAIAQKAIAQAPASGDWEGALKHVAEAIGAWGCHLNRTSPSRGLLASKRGGISSDFVREFEKRKGTRPELNLRAKALYSIPCLRACAEDDFVDADGWIHSSYFQDFLLKFDAPFSVFGKLFESTKDVTSVFALRSLKQGPASANDKKAMNYLLPSLQAAVGMQEMLEQRGLTIAARSLDHIGSAAIFCDASLNVTAISATSEKDEREGQYLSIRGNKVCLAQARDHFKLEQVARATEGFAVNTAIRVTNKTGVRQRTLRIASAIEPDSTSGFNAKLVLLLLDDEAPVASEKNGAVQLTPAEIEIAKQLISGRTTRSIAESRNVSITTVQTQIKSIAGKFGAGHRGALLAALRGWISS